MTWLLWLTVVGWAPPQPMWEVFESLEQCEKRVLPPTIFHRFYEPLFTVETCAPYEKIRDACECEGK